MRILFEGPFKGTYSLAMVNQKIAQLLACDNDLLVKAAEPDIMSDPVFTAHGLKPFLINGEADIKDIDLHIRNTWPPSVEGMKGRRNAYVGFAWEETTFPQVYVDGLNQLDFIAVTSDFCARAFRASGIRVPIFNIGNPVYAGVDVQSIMIPDGRYPAYDAWRHHEKRLLHVSSAFWRKGVDVLFQSFCDALVDTTDSALLVKTHWTPSSYLREALAQVQGRAGSERIFVLEHDISEAELEKIYLDSTACVFPSRGEGFLLPAAEAMLKRKPVISTAFSGQMDFCLPDHFLPVDYTLIRSRSHVSDATSLIAEPSRESLAACLKSIVVAQSPSDVVNIDAAEAFVRHAYNKDVYRSNLFRAIEVQSDGSPGGKIGVISTWGEKCGLFEYAQDMIRAINADTEHWQFRMYSRDPGASAVNPSLKLDVSYFSSLDEDFLTIVRQACQENDLVLVNNHLGHVGITSLCEGARIAQVLGRPFVVIAHNANDWAPLPEVRVLNDLGVLVVVHSVVEQLHLSRCGFNNSWMIDHPVTASTSFTRRELCDIRQAPRIASFGFALPHKGYDNLVSAFSILCQTYPKAHLSIFAARTEAAKSIYTVDLLREQIQFLGLERNVTLTTSFLGKATLAKLLSQHDFAVLPYLDSSEGASGAIRTCIGVGVPIVTSNSRIFADFQEYLPRFEAGSVGSCAHVLAAMVEEAGLLIHTDRAVCRMKDTLSWGKMRNRYECLFDYALKATYRNLLCDNPSSNLVPCFDTELTT